MGRPTMYVHGEADEGAIKAELIIDEDTTSDSLVRVDCDGFDLILDMESVRRLLAELNRVTDEFVAVLDAEEDV